MGDPSAHLAGQIDPWPSKDDMASILRSAGLRIYLGRYSIRIQDCSHFVFQEYGGDLGEPVIDADAESVQKMQRDGQLVSSALARAGIKHQFEVYDENDSLVGYIHHNWPPPAPGL